MGQGVVTAVAIQCAPRPASVQVAMLRCASFAAVRAALRLARARLGEILSAVEFMDAASMAVALEQLPGARNPLAGGSSNSGSGGEGGGEGGAVDLSNAGAPFYMVIETHGSDAAHDAEKLERFLEAAAADGAVEDGTVAASGAQADEIWRVREGVSEALSRRGERGR